MDLCNARRRLAAGRRFQRYKKNGTTLKTVSGHSRQRIMVLLLPNLLSHPPMRQVGDPFSGYCGQTMIWTGVTADGTIINGSKAGKN
jgi:hypothetical protein